MSAAERPASREVDGAIATSGAPGRPQPPTHAASLAESAQHAGSNVPNGWSTSENGLGTTTLNAVAEPLGEPLSEPGRLGPSSKAHREAALQVTADFIAAAAALPVGLVLLAWLSSVQQNSLSNFTHNLQVDWLFPFLAIAALATSGFYRSARRSAQPNTFLELKDLAFAIGTGCFLALAVGVAGHGLFQTSELPSSQIITAGVVALAFVATSRTCLRALRRSVITTRVVLVGSGHLIGRVRRYLEMAKGVTVVGRVSDDRSNLDGASLGALADLPRLCQEHRVDWLIVGFPSEVSEASVETLRTLQDRVRISMIPRYYELISWRSRMSDLYGLPLLDVAPRHLSLWDRFAKRAVDVIAAGLVLVVLFPVFLAVALLVKGTSSGPVLFKQERVGRNRQHFTIFKFRTMRVPEPTDGTNGDTTGDNSRTEPADAEVPLYQLRQKLAEQERITPLGRFLRKTSIDELPQFLNVLAGHMSLVGPRPFVPHETVAMDNWMSRRFEVRPGITGLWQVSGRNDLTAEDLHRLDYLYVASWSMGWDLKILWDTPRVVARGLGAY